MGKGDHIEKVMTNKYKIDIGGIFSKVHENWSEYDRNFLEKDFQNALISISNKHKIFEATFSESQIEYYKRLQNDYKNDLDNANNLDSFPFPDYYFIYNKTTDAYPSVISFHTPYILERGEFYFDFFFAMKITTVDLMEIDDFFKFHFRTSFKKNKNTYLNFLNKLLIKYDKLLIRKYSIAITEFMNKIKNEGSNNVNKQKVPTSVTNQQKMEPEIKVNQVKWQGNNETELVQLIYALFEAGYITNEGNSITKIVNQFAENLDFKLGNNWQSNLSKSINERNNDYNPEIFEKMATGFNKYREKIKSKKKKNTSK